MFKRKFLSSAVLSSHCACVYIYIQCTVITFSIERTMPCEEKKERKKVKILNGRQGEQYCTLRYGEGEREGTRCNRRKEKGQLLLFLT